MPVSGTTLNGAGMGETILQASAPLAIDVITIGLEKTNYRGGGFTVSNLTIDGNLHVNANNAQKVGRGVVVQGGVVQAFITNVETRYGLDGISIAGSQIAATGIYTHDNRHSGFFVQGNANMPAPYELADSVSLKASRADNNNLDNTPGKTWDDVDFDRRTSNGTIGGPDAGDGNELTGGDILLSCTPSACPATIGPFTVQGNTVNGTNQAGVRVYGDVTGALVIGNTLNVAPSGINVVGPVTNSTVSNNTVSGPVAYGINIFPLSGFPVGNEIIVAANNVMMGNIKKPAFAVVGATNVTLANNNAEGASYDTSQAGAGLMMIGNQ